LYIDDRHVGQLQLSLSCAYVALATDDSHTFAAAKSAIFLVACYLIKLGYFLGLAKWVLISRKVVPFLGFSSDSAREVFALLPHKKEKFLRQILASTTLSVITIKRLVGKRVSFSLAVPAALLFTREMNAAIGQSNCLARPVQIQGCPKDQIAHWLFLETWDDLLPWRDERHVRLMVGCVWNGLLGRLYRVSCSRGKHF
jgi:hypothetical protein